MNSSSSNGDSAASQPTGEEETLSEENLELLSLVRKFFHLFGIFFFGYIIGYLGLSLWWISVAAFLLVGREKHYSVHQRRVDFQRAVANDEKSIIKCSVKDLPCWVLFPDTERAEWLNRALKQLWPFVAQYLADFLKANAEQNIDDIMPDYCKGFRFEKIDFGSVVPRIGSVKCYDENTDRKEIILDIELIYAGDCDIQVKIKGLGAGIKDFQVYGVMRVELKPLIKDMPLVGCVSFYFLKNPVIEYNFTNLGNILDFPVMSEFLRRGIKEQFAKLLVLPNKFVLPLVPDFQASSIKFTQPIGVVRLEVIEARHLKKSDVGMLGLGKSDPYVNIIVGSQEFRTATIYNTVNPKWNFICETPVFLTTQSIDLEVMDEDQGSKDDFLGKAYFSLDSIKKDGVVDAWSNLKETKTGRVHVKMTWFTLEHSTANLAAQSKEGSRVRARYHRGLTEEQGQSSSSRSGEQQPIGSVACLLVYLDCAKHLPISAKSIGEPSPQVIFKLRRQTQRSIVKNFTSNPIWEETFHFLLDDYSPHDELSIEVVDSKSSQLIGHVSVRMQSLVESKDMTFTEPLLVRQFSHSFDLHCKLSLYFLRSPSQEKVKIVRDDTVDSEDADNIPTMEDMIKGTVEPFAMFSGIQGEKLIEISQHKRLNGNNKNGHSRDPLLSESAANNGGGGDPRSKELELNIYPMLQVSVNKLLEENKLEVLVHKASNLRRINNQLPNPYVKLYLQPDRKVVRDKRNRSVTIKSTCHPVFEERFYVDLNEDIESLKFVVFTSTNGIIFKRGKVSLGYVEIYFNDNFLEKNSLSFTKWYELEQQDD